MLTLDSWKVLDCRLAKANAYEIEVISDCGLLSIVRKYTDTEELNDQGNIRTKVSYENLREVGMCTQDDAVKIARDYVSHLEKHACIVLANDQLS